MRRSPLPLVLPLVALTACSAAPVTFPIESFRLNFSAVGDTQGRVIYPATKAQFQRTTVSVKTVVIDGTVVASNVDTPLSFTLYGRTVDPASDPNCSRVPPITGTYFVCEEQGEAKVSNTLTFNAASPSQRVRMSGPVLATGVNQGSMWLGARVEGETSVNVQLEFTNLRATVTVF